MSEQVESKKHLMETRIQTVGMSLIIGFLAWVGTGLVDVKVGLAQLLAESMALKTTLEKQDQRLTVIEGEISGMKDKMGEFVTREELRQIIKDNKNQ